MAKIAACPISDPEQPVAYTLMIPKHTNRDPRGKVRYFKKSALQKYIDRMNDVVLWQQTH